MPDQNNKDTCAMHSDRIHELDLSMVEIKGDVKHIRDRIDNGLTSTVAKIWDMMNDMCVDREVMKANVETNKAFISKITTGLISLAVFGLGGGVIAFAIKVAHAYAQGTQ